MQNDHKDPVCVMKSFTSCGSLFCPLVFRLELLLLSLRYDRQKMTLKEIRSCQYVACMNPMVGSFTVNPRLQVGFVPLSLDVLGCHIQDVDQAGYVGTL